MEKIYEKRITAIESLLISHLNLPSDELGITIDVSKHEGIPDILHIVLDFKTGCDPILEDVIRKLNELKSKLDSFFRKYAINQDCKIVRGPSKNESPLISNINYSLDYEELGVNLAYLIYLDE